MKQATFACIVTLAVAAGSASAQSAADVAVLPTFDGCPSLMWSRPSERGWVAAEYLLWWTKAGPMPAAAATIGDPNVAVPGALGQNGTRVVLGESDLNYGATSGLRIGLGFWLGADSCFAVEASGFLLDNRTYLRTVASDATGNPGIFIPINDVVFGEDSFTVSFPGAVSGSISLSSTSRLWGAETNLLAHFHEDRNGIVRLLAGFRHVNLEERIEIAKIANDFAGILNSPSNPGNPEPPGSVIRTRDSFLGRNLFFGGQIGMRGQASQDRWTFDLCVKIAFGSTIQMMDITGAIAHEQPGAATTNIPIGILAGASNSGHFRRDAFSVIPEIEVKLSHDLNDSCRVFAGYNYLYWSNVARPGNQISRNIDERTTPIANSFLPGFSSNLPPAPTFTRSDFWAHGLSFGIEFRY